eukprot:51525-Eustigmatos_ZCMA.PRE.2
MCQAIIAFISWKLYTGLPSSHRRGVGGRKTEGGAYIARTWIGIKQRSSTNKSNDTVPAFIAGARRQTTGGLCVAAGGVGC